MLIPSVLLLLLPLLHPAQVYINARTPAIDAELAPYLEKYGPEKFRIMGDKNNCEGREGRREVKGTCAFPCVFLLRE